MVRKFLVSFDFEKLKEYCLVLSFFVSLFTSTCFFFDPREIKLFGLPAQLPVHLAFFPLTFAISNIIQDKFGEKTAKSLVIAAFIFDTLLVFGGVFLAWIGDRTDYQTVFNDMPSIMIATWFFMGISSIFNTLLYSYLKRKKPRNSFDIIYRFFLTITATELLLSSMSMPFMFYQHGLSGSLMLTILIAVTYKVVSNIVITIGYGIFLKKPYLK